MRSGIVGTRLRFVGTFYLGVDFANDGNLLMTPDNFAAYFPYRVPGSDPLSVVDLAVVQIRAGAKLEACERSSTAAARRCSRVHQEEFIAREKKFWRASTPVGYIFMVGVVVGFFVGVIICYQIIYADITDHMPEFATMKAMGYRGPYFFGLVLSQASYLSILGFVPGLHRQPALSIGCWPRSPG